MRDPASGGASTGPWGIPFAVFDGVAVALLVAVVALGAAAIWNGVANTPLLASVVVSAPGNTPLLAPGAAPVAASALASTTWAGTLTGVVLLISAGCSAVSDWQTTAAGDRQVVKAAVLVVSVLAVAASGTGIVSTIVLQSDHYAESSTLGVQAAQLLGGLILSAIATAFLVHVLRQEAMTGPYEDEEETDEVWARPREVIAPDPPGAGADTGEDDSIWAPERDS